MKPISFFRRDDAWQTAAFSPPWGRERSAIYDHLAAISSHGGNPNEIDLPDEGQFSGGGRIRFVGGLLDNMTSQEAWNGPAIHTALLLLLAKRNDENIARFYQILKDSRAVEAINDLIARIQRDPPQRMDRFAALFEWLARKAPDREPVKFAIGMLGLVEGARFRELFLLLGAHEEFTGFAATALEITLPSNEGRAALEGLAREVTGWGRIGLVERLAPDCDAAFRHWLVRDGYRNSILDEYLAGIAAQQGLLLSQLKSPEANADAALLDGAAGIFEALVAGGPVVGMAGYEDGAEAAICWLGLIGGHNATLPRAGAAMALLEYSRNEENEAGLAPWDRASAHRVAQLTSDYLRRDDLRSLVAVALEDGDLPNYWQGHRVAVAAGIDPWPCSFDRQSRDASADHWYHLMQTDDPVRIDRVIDLAIHQLPLEQIAAGAQKELGLGPEWRAHSALGFVVQDLRRFSGKGWVLIAAALKSPVTWNRNMAIIALEHWNRYDWPPQADLALRLAMRDEPDDGVRRRIEPLLRPKA